MTVYALSGRRPDPPGAEFRRFPLENHDLVRERIQFLFEDNAARTLVASAACGADLIALQVAEALGMERHVVLPFASLDFRRTSVVDRPGDWGDLFDRTIDTIQRTGKLTDLGLSPGSDDAYNLANEAIIATAEHLPVGHETVRMCLVWEGAPRGSGDISYDMAQQADALGWPVDEIKTL